MDHATQTQDPNTDHDDGDEGNAPDVRPAATAEAPMSPLDASFRRGNPRRPAQPPSLFDQPEPLALPPMGLNPGIVAAHALYTEADASVCSPVVAALEALHGAAERTIAARQQLQGNIALSEGQQVIEVATLHEKLSTSALKKTDAALASLKSSIRSLETELSVPVQAVANNPVAQEVRAYLRSLPESKRLGVVMQAINDGDVTTAGAVLAQNLPAYLTGLPADSLPVIHKTWNTKRNPQAAQRLELLRDLQVKVDAAGTQLTTLGERLIGSSHTTVNKLREHQSQLRRVTGAVA